MESTKIFNQKIRQNRAVPHTSHLALGNLWKASDVGVSGFTFASTNRGRSEIAEPVWSD